MSLSTPFSRTGDLKDLASYPLWLQQVVRDTNPAKEALLQHLLLQQGRDATLPLAKLQRMLAGLWPTIERFPQFMSMNLTKIQYGRSPGKDMARNYLMHNIRVEQKHAQYWHEWATAAGLTLDDMHAAEACEPIHAVAHWCWYICAQPSLAVAIAATNYAIEGAAGESSCLVLTKEMYAQTLPEAMRTQGMRWLRVHAEYDDTHPWEALEIVATLLGHNPPQPEVDAVRRAILASFNYMRIAYDGIMDTAQSQARAPQPEALAA